MTKVQHYTEYVCETPRECWRIVLREKQRRADSQQREHAPCQCLRVMRLEDLVFTAQTEDWFVLQERRQHSFLVSSLLCYLILFVAFLVPRRLIGTALRSSRLYFRRTDARRRAVRMF